MNLINSIYTILEEPEKDKASYWFHVFIYTLIIISIISLMLSSVQEYNAKYKIIFTYITNIIMPIFIIEYLARLYASGRLESYKGLSGKLRYILTPYAIIDLLTLLPYLLVGFGIDGSFIRSLRLFRIFRLFRINKYRKFIKQMQNIISSKKEEFTVLLFFTFIIVILLSFVMFEVEHQAQPNVYSNIFQTIWWAVATLTTVGYGDMYPVTAFGKIITAIISILGIAFIAIPGGIFASEFINSFSNEEKKNICPKCSSEDLISHPKPIVNFSDKNKQFNDLVECQKCKFSWLT